MELVLDELFLLPFLGNLRWVFGGGVGGGGAGKILAFVLFFFIFLFFGGGLIDFAE